MPDPARAIRSFVIRAGRMTRAQHRALAELLPRYAIDAVTLDRARLDDPAGQRALHLEIGIGNGDNLVALAARRPGHSYIGCEVHAPGLGHALLCLHERGLSNLRLHAGDAVEFLAALPDATLAVVYIFFPDPWPKTRHHKRRLVGPALLTLLARKLRRGGRLYFASDLGEYAESVRDAIAASPAWRNLAGPRQWAPRPRWRSLTRFEQRARDAGSRVFDLAAALADC